MKWAHGPCEACGSSDANTTYDDGHSYCFACQAYVRASEGEGEGEAQPVKTPTSELTSLAIPDRGLEASIIKMYGVKVRLDETTGEVAEHAYPYFNENDSLSSWKVRKVENKEFYSTGEMRKCKLFGQSVDGGSRLLVITEGEVDAMSAKQMFLAQGKNYSVVSLPHGTNSQQSLQDNLEYLESFESIVLCFDNDESGLRGVDSAIPLFTLGKAKVARLPLKDANDMLLADRGEEFIKAIWNAKAKRPDGIVELSDGWEAMFEDEGVLSTPYPWAGLNEKLYGLRGREIVTITAGSGVGKSAIAREISYHLLKTTQDNIGILALEESIGRTEWGFVSMEANLPLMIREERIGVSKEDIRGWFNTTMGTGRLFALDHFGSTDSDSLLSKIRFLIKAYNCKWILLDHLSIIVSAMDDGMDERRVIDKLMTHLRMLTEETGVGMILVVHLRRVGGDKGHEQGVEVSLSHLRGSQAIAQLSDVVVAGERNQQADNIVESNTTILRVLKNRYAGLTGRAGSLFYNGETGRLVETPDIVAEEEDF